MGEKGKILPKKEIATRVQMSQSMSPIFLEHGKKNKTKQNSHQTVKHEKYKTSRIFGNNTTPRSPLFIISFRTKLHQSLNSLAFVTPVRIFRGHRSAIIVLHLGPVLKLCMDLLLPLLNISVCYRRLNILVPLS